MLAKARVELGDHAEAEESVGGDVLIAAEAPGERAAVAAASRNSGSVPWAGSHRNRGRTARTASSAAASRGQHVQSRRDAVDAMDEQRK